MTTTLDWLKTKDWAELAFSLVFDGYDLIYTTANELTGAGSMTAAYSATDWTTVKGGLDIIGTIEESIQLFNPEIKANRLRFRCLDQDGTLAQTLFAPERRNTGDWINYITQDVLPSATSIPVQDTSLLSASSGVYYLGLEAGAYGSKTGTTLGTLTRGKWALFGTASTPTRYPRHHRMMPDAYGQRAIAPPVTNYPRTFYNRMVALYVHHREGGAWATRDNAHLLWVGRLKDWGESGNGWVELVATSVHELLHQEVFSDQFTAQLGHGALSTSDIDRQLRVFSQTTDSIGAVNYDAAVTTLGTTGTRYTWADICSLIQEQFSTWQNAGTIHSRHRWSVSLERRNDKDLVVLAVELVGATFPNNTLEVLGLSMSTKWWLLLGATDFGLQTTDGNGNTYGFRELHRATNTRWELVLENAPIDYVDFSQASGSLLSYGFEVVNVRGTWLYQPVEGLSAKYQWGYSGVSASGFMSLGSELYAIEDFVPDADPTTGIVTIQRRVGPDLDGAVAATNVRASAGGSAPEVKQVWFEPRRAGELLLRLMLSTGDSGFNTSTYDVYPAGFGLGIPYGLVDVPSFLAVEDRWELALEKPKAFREFMESILAATGRYLVWRNGKLTLTPPGFDSPYVEDIVILDETNKGRPPPAARSREGIADRAPISYAPDTIINRIRVKYGSTELGKIETPSLGDRTRVSTIVVEDVASASDYGERKKVELEAGGMLDPRSTIDYVIAPALAYFSRPLGQITRSINGKLLYATCGDTAQLTDNSLIDPRTGLRGIAGLACWIKGKKFDFKRGVGSLELAFLPSHPASRFCLWAPSGSITAYNSGTATLTLSANAFSRAGAPVDASRFAAGDKIAIIEVSPTNPASPTRHTATVQSVNAGANTVTLTSDPTGGAGLDFANKAWALEYDSSTVVQVSQRAKAFVAGDTGAPPTTGLLDDDAKLWAGSNSRWFTAFDTGAINYIQPFVRPSDQASQQGRPYSVHTAYYQLLSANVMLGHATCAHHLNDILPAEVTHNATTWKLVYLIKVPLFGVHHIQSGSLGGGRAIRKLRGKVWMRRTAAVGTNGQVRIVSSPQLPHDPADALDVVWPTGALKVTKTETATTLTWSSTFELEPVVVWADPLPFTWIGVEVSEAGGATGGWRGIALAEQVLS